MEDDKKSASKAKEEKDFEDDDLDDIDDELFEDDEEFDDQEEDTWERMRNWVQDNLRVILSVLIVALIAVGIYNYSRKPAEEGKISQIDEIVSEEGEIAIVEEEEPEGEIEVKGSDEAEEVVEVKDDAKQETVTPEPEAPKPEVQKEETSSGKVYKVTAGSGEGTTHLARRALKDYLGSAPDSGLTKEHKIYIEDYMRRQAGAGWLNVGETREFSEGLVKEAIAKAKTLDDRQLQNLKRYSARVPSL